jgi:ubiquitin thioesterase OTU1
MFVLFLCAGVVQGKGWEYPSTVNKNHAMARHVMPKDNSCLFHCIAHVLDVKGDSAQEKSQRMRQLVSSIIRGNPSKYNSAFLGMNSTNYANVVTDPNQWGGAIELAIFSEHFRIEIVAFDYHWLREDTFGSRYTLSE